MNHSASLGLNRRFVHLDMLRGISALLVLAGHTRSLVFQNFESISHPSSLLTKLYYFATGLGHQSVVVFFALSGFMVGGSAIAQLVKGNFSWRRYLTRRLSRLWIVLAPALVLTKVLDAIGSTGSARIAYEGAFYPIFASGPVEPISSTLETFLGNFVFVQRIYVPVFGSNGPLWSLTNEFWYYIFFPLLFWTFLPNVSWAQRTVGILTLGLVATALPSWLIEGGVIWAAGAAASHIAAAPSLAPFLGKRVTIAFAASSFVGALILTKIPESGIGDLPLGIVAATALTVFAHAPPIGQLYARVALGLSNVSYTLYLTHFPLVFMLATLLFAPARFTPGVQSSLIYIAMLFVAILWAIFIWWCFERHTARAQDRLNYLLSPVTLKKIASIIAWR